MSANPYENEPGYEKSRGEKDKNARKSYVDKVSPLS